MFSKTAIEEFLKQPSNNFEWIKDVSEEELLSEVYETYPEFKWKTFPPLKHQLECLLIGMSDPTFLYLLDMGGTKTSISLYLVSYYLWKVKPKRLKTLVLTPSTVSTMSWMEQIEMHSYLSATALLGTFKEKWDLLTEKDTDLYVLNYDGLQSLCTKKVFVKRSKKSRLVPDEDLLKKFVSMFDIVIYDEIHNAKSSKTLCFTLCDALASKCQYRYGLTGTPMGRSPVDLWSQFYLIDRGETLGKYISLYREAFFDQKRNFFGGIDYKFREKMKKDLYAKIKNKSIRYDAEEFGHIPMISNRIHVKMPEEFKIYYKDVIQGIINAKNMDTVLIESSFIRMRQITAGFLEFDNADEERISIIFDANPKLDALVDLIKETPVDAKVIVFNEFIRSGEMICQRLTEEKIGHHRLYGGTKDKEGVLKEFAKKDCKVFVINASSGGTGLNLQEANYVIFYESPLSPIIRKQAIARSKRQGQVKTVFLYDILMKNSIDEKIHGYLEQGENLFNALLNSKSSAQLLKFLI